MAAGKKKIALVTGSSGLIGSEVVDYFCRLGWEVHGVDNNMRADFFGVEGDTRWNQRRLAETHQRFHHHELDIRDRAGVDALVAEVKPGLAVHAAAQPSHDLAASRPLDDFDVNAAGTLNVLDAHRRHAIGWPFVYMSTNKVYGDAPNEIALVERETRWDYADPAFAAGIDETLRIDRDVLHVEDLADLVVERLRDLPRWSGWTGNVSGGIENSMSLVELTALCREATGRKTTIGLSAQNRAADVRIYVGDCSELFSRTDWRPRRSLQRIVEDMAAWARDERGHLESLWAKAG